MKRMRLILVAVFATMCLGAFAQVEKGCNSVYVQWNPSSFVPKEGDSQSFTGFSIGYNRTINIVANVPLYAEIGGAIQYSFQSEEVPVTSEMVKYGFDEKEKLRDEKVSLLSVKVPVNVLYKHQVPNSKIAIAPFAGLTFRGNILGKIKTEYNKDVTDRIPRVATKNPTNWDSDLNLFNKDDMGNDDVWKRFQIGWQVGVNVYYSSFYAGVSYGTDFSQISQNVKIHTTSVNIGYTF